MHTKHVIFLVSCILIGSIIFGPLDNYTAHASGTRMITNTAYTTSNEKRSADTPNSIITILISGSTNSCATTMNVHFTGAVAYQACYTTHNGSISPMLTRTFFGDVQEAQPLGALPRNSGCIKAISFATTTRIRAQAQESPDVSCSTDPLGMKLNGDVKTIQNTLHFRVQRYPITQRS